MGKDGGKIEIEKRSNLTNPFVVGEDTLDRCSFLKSSFRCNEPFGVAGVP